MLVKCMQIWDVYLSVVLVWLRVPARTVVRGASMWHVHMWWWNAAQRVIPLGEPPGR